MDSLVVHEIYASIQGETRFAGLPCTFIRTTGCNLRCSWCDTTQAFKGGTRMSLDDIIAKATTFETQLVELTGGEPLLQAGAIPLLERLCELGKVVLLETSGERDISRVPLGVHRIVDLKAPGSGENHRNRWENLDHLSWRDSVKMVLKDRADYEWARSVIAGERLDARCDEVLLSPVHGVLDPRELVAWVLEDRLPVRVNLQLHKYVWGPNAESV